MDIQPFRRFAVYEALSVAKRLTPTVARPAAKGPQADVPPSPVNLRFLAVIGRGRDLIRLRRIEWTAAEHDRPVRSIVQSGGG